QVDCSGWLGSCDRSLNGAGHGAYSEPDLYSRNPNGVVELPGLDNNLVVFWDAACHLYPCSGGCSQPRRNRSTGGTQNWTFRHERSIAWLVRGGMPGVQQACFASSGIQRGSDLVCSSPAIYGWCCSDLNRGRISKQASFCDNLFYFAKRIEGNFMSTHTMRLGPLEIQVMEVLWSEKSATIRQVITILGQNHAYTTIATVLGNLERKTLVHPLRGHGRTVQ